MPPPALSSNTSCATSAIFTRVELVSNPPHLSLEADLILDNPQYGNLRRVCRYRPPGHFLLVRLDPRLVLTAAGKERTKTLPGHMT